MLMIVTIDNNDNDNIDDNFNDDYIDNNVVTIVIVTQL